MSKYELVELLEGIKRRYCQAVQQGYRVVIRSEMARMEEVRTRLYALNLEKGFEVFDERPR
jgi:hypothetical protein